ncbi:hypothetical protein O6H91_20G076500 [Diphasiastrum complanatum]|uniref:Uncharacterized protein n=1 Tax=Diphasiastrum complanatum TaxID=34168 RepID=A0ACC2ARX9_DIPCM|nr:hypothetical protein O6H91_20G076500 [Diphasiastrum complanatum]
MMDNVFIGQLIGAGLVLICSLLWLFLIRVKIPKGVPPGSFGWPLLGETIEYLNYRYKSGAAAFFNERRKRTHIFFCPTVVIAGADAHKLLQNDGYRTLTFGHSQMMRDLFGETSLLLTEGDQHKRMRKVILGSMNLKVLKSQIPILEGLSIETLKSWEGAEVLAYDELAKFTFYSIMGLLLSLKPSPYTETLRQDFQILAKYGVSLPLKNIPGSSFNRALQARKRLVDEIKKVVEDRRKDGNASEDVLNYLMQPKGISRSDLHLSDEEIIDNVLFFIFAGYETTSTALAKIIQLLSDHPHEQNLVKAEHQRVQQELEDEGCLTWEKLKSMHYTSMVINEALRLSHLGTEVFLRTSKEDIAFHGYTIPRGWNIIIDKATTDINPDIFEEPLKFNPDRFQKNIPPYVLIPFGSGTRICAGMEFANIEMLVFIHTLVKNYSWRLTQEHNDEMEFTGVVEKPKNGIPILIQKLHF